MNVLDVQCNVLINIRSKIIVITKQINIMNLLIFILVTDIVLFLQILCVSLLGIAITNYQRLGTLLKKGSGGQE